MFPPKLKNLESPKKKPKKAKKDLESLLKIHPIDSSNPLLSPKRASSSDKFSTPPKTKVH